MILSHPLSYEMKPARSPWLMTKLLARYPQIAQAMLVRAENYNQSLEFIRNPPEGTTIRVIAPPEDFAVKRLSMKSPTLIAGYEMGVTAGVDHLSSREGTFGLDIENCHFCL